MPHMGRKRPPHIRDDRAKIDFILQLTSLEEIIKLIQIEK